MEINNPYLTYGKVKSVILYQAKIAYPELGEVNLPVTVLDLDRGQPISARDILNNLPAKLNEEELILLCSFPRHLTENEIDKILGQEVSYRQVHSHNQKYTNSIRSRIEVLDGLNKGFTLEGKVERINPVHSSLPQ